MNIHGSMAEIAFNILLKKTKSMSFDKLWASVKKILGVTGQEADDLIADFYAELTLDPRIVNLPDNTWDLRDRVSYDQSHTDSYDEYEDEEDIDEYDEDEDEERHNDEDGWDEEGNNEEEL